jgi:hypothetical protein
VESTIIIEGCRGKVLSKIRFERVSSVFVGRVLGLGIYWGRCVGLM